MAHAPPEHCPACGTALEAVDPPTVHRCPVCVECVVHNPTPNCRVVLVDDDRSLPVEILGEYRGDDPLCPTGASRCSLVATRR